MRTENKSEIQKFTNLSRDWGKKNGSFAMLYKMNQLRVQYIAQNAQIKDSQILDIGCGGGLLAEELSSMGGKVMAIDPCPHSIISAKDNSKSNVEYLNISIEEFAQQEHYFDVICLMEVVEHVDNLNYFIKLCCGMLKQNAKIFFSTINRTTFSYLLGIIAAEYILRLLPKNTHSWSKFVKPSEMVKFLEENGVMIKNLSGMKYKILTDTWVIKKNLDVNYIGFATKS